MIHKLYLFCFLTLDVTWKGGMLDSLRKLKDNGDVLVFNVVSEPMDDDGGAGEVECPIVG